MQSGLRKKKRQRAYLVSPYVALRYTAEFLLMILFFSTGKTGFALALGLFAGLTFARQNLIITAPMFVVAGMVFLDSWWTMMFLAIPPVVFAVLYFLYTRFKKNVPVWAVVFCTLISALAESVTRLLLFGDGLRFALTVVLSVVFALCCTNACYAVLIRGIKCRFTLDEHICTAIFAVAFAYACHGVSVYGFNLYFLILPFVIMCFAYGGSGRNAILVSVLFSLGAVLDGFDFSLVGVSVLLGFVATALTSFHRFIPAVSMAVLMIGFWLLKIGDLGYQGAVMTLIGGFAYGFLPRDIRSKFPRQSRDKAESLCAMVNRDRTNLSNRLLSVSDVFLDLAEQLDDDDNDKNPYTAKRLSKEIAKNYCGKCSERQKCFSALGGDTSSVLEGMCEATLTRNKATILDVPNFISSRCIKTHNLISVINNAGEAYKTKIAGSRELFNCKKTMSAQFAGMSLVLESLSKECGKNLTFGGDVEERIENELMKHNIVATETVVAGKGASSRVALTVRDVDVEKTMLTKTVSNCLQNPYVIEKVTDRGEEKTVHLVTAPVFQVAYGVAEKRRDGEEVSGDSMAVLSPSMNKRIFALSDGMGSGEKASIASKKSLSMIENFYRAGFEEGLILSLVNQLLCLVSEDNFSALDIAVVDLALGGVDVIKMGAASGFILRKSAVEVLRADTPPLGIVDRIAPTTARHQLYDGDMLVLATDGVLDALGENGVVDVVDEAHTTNPQTLADKLLLGALSRGAEDDCTVLVLRILAI